MVSSVFNNKKRNGIRGEHYTSLATTTHINVKKAFSAHA